MKTTMHTSIFALLLAAAGAGCTIPVSNHPLTDEKTSIVDERLIGHWEIVPEDDDSDETMPRYAVGRVKGLKNTLELVYLEIDEDDRVEVQRELVYSTQIAVHHYVSLRVTDDDETGYLVMLYRLTDQDTIRLHLMNHKVLAEDIESGRLKGMVKRSKRPPDSDPSKPFEEKIEEVRITAAPKELAAYLKARGGACFVMDKPATLRRIDP